MKLANQCSGRLQELYPASSTSVRILPVAVVFHQDRLFVANGMTSEPGIYVLQANRGTLFSTITSPLLPSPSGMCIVDNCLMVTCENHTIVKVSHMDTKVTVENFTGKANEPGAEDGVVSSARFHSPHSIANMGSSLFICDSKISPSVLLQTQNPCGSCRHLCIHTPKCLKLTTIEELRGFRFLKQCR